MRVIIFHGWGATSRDNWFVWLKEELEEQGHEVYVPDLPDSQHPKQEAWMRQAEKLPIDVETVLVGHSLGAVLIMRLLEQMKAKAALLVAGFDDHLGIEQIRDFFKKSFDYEAIRKNADITLICSDNDPYISNRIFDGLAEKLKCRKVVFEGKGHLSLGTQEGRFEELQAMILEKDKEQI